MSMFLINKLNLIVEMLQRIERTNTEILRKLETGLDGVYRPDMGYQQYIGGIQECSDILGKALRDKELEKQEALKTRDNRIGKPEQMEK